MKIDTTGHSPLGASGTHRWMVCLGSVGLGYGINDDEEDDTFSMPGHAAHMLAKIALAKQVDPWQHIGMTFNPATEEISGEASSPGCLITKTMADAVEEYIEAINRAHPDRNQSNTWVEHKFHCPSIHPLFFGQTDLGHLMLNARRLDVWDFKYGAGVVVEAEDNPQLKYYACGFLESRGLWDAVDTVVLHIAQPRAWHWLSTMRDWAIRTEDLITWLEGTLVPSMDRALVSRDTKSGEHCRFCPVRYRKCPQLTKDMKELETMLKALEGKTAEVLTNDELSRLLKLVQLSRIVGKAAEQTAFNRIVHGKAVPGCKLVKARSNREWKEGVEAEAKTEFGEAAYADRELRSPAQMEALPGGVEFTARYSFKPDKGLTLVLGEDARPAMSKDTKSLFEPVKRKK